ncbi:MAG: SDR family NAD(P)-dependent oxidoreductase [Christensenellales bacterium]
MGGLDGRVALITGGGKGIGKGISLALAQQGVKLIIGCNSTLGLAQETLKELRKYTDAELIQADVGTYEGCKRLADAPIQRFGRLDILVNNAAIQSQYSLLESSVEIFRKEYNVNLRAAFYLIQLCVPYIRESKQGRIVLISSVHAKRPTDFDAAYAVSKGSMTMLMREAAVELAPLGITVNCVAPGGVKIEGKTGNPRKFTVRSFLEQKTRNPFRMGRYGLPRDTAGIVAYLVGAEADHVTGTTIRVDGGSMLV